MSCLNPRTVGFKPDGKTLSWSQKEYSKEFATFQLPCRKCIECRLDHGRQWAIRALHESQLHENNCFITLTYDDAHLGNNKLQYTDFQKFIKDLRQSLDYKGIDHQIGFMAVGEYGSKTKRKHWHACLFGWTPHDPEYKYTTDLDHKVYSSKFLTDIWEKGIAEFGNVTLQSASYVARYSAKKLTHGKDQDHDYHPIFKASSKNAIGKKWLEKFWPDIFNLGATVLPNGEIAPIPRYYEKWLKKNQPAAWADYVTNIKAEIIKEANERNEKDHQITKETNMSRAGLKGPQRTKSEARRVILTNKFNSLQQRQKI